MFVSAADDADSTAPPPSAPPAPVALTVDATERSGDLSPFLFGIALDRWPDEDDIVRLAATGYRMLWLHHWRFDDGIDEPARAAVMRRGLEVLAATGVIPVLEPPQTEGDDAATILYRLLAAATPEGPPPAPLFVSLGENDADSAESIPLRPSARPFVFWRAGSRGVVAADSMLQRVRRWPQTNGVSVELRRADSLAQWRRRLRDTAVGSAAPRLLCSFPLRPAVPVAVSLTRWLVALVDAGAFASAPTPETLPASSPQRAAYDAAVRIFSDWARLPQPAIRTHADLPLSVVGARHDGRVVVCVANQSDKPVEAPLRITVMPGLYDIETRTLPANAARAQPTQTRAPWRCQEQPSGSASMAMTWPPGAVVVVRLTDHLRRGYRVLGEAAQQLNSLAGLSPVDRQRLTDAVREARQAPANLITHRDYRNQSVIRAAHRALLGVDQADMVLRNCMSSPRLDAVAAAAIAGQLELAVEHFSQASLTAFGLRWGVGVTPGPSGREYRVTLTHAGAESVHNLRVALMSPVKGVLEAASRPELRPGETWVTRLRAPSGESDALVQMSYYAGRSFARLHRELTEP